MDLTPYVDHLRQQLAVAAEAGGDETRELAERLASALESSTRLTLLNALSAAMTEVTRDLAPGSVDVRLRGLDPEFVVTPPHTDEPYADADGPERAPSGPPASAPPAPPDGDESAMARINFRLPAHLKTRIENAAGREDLSVNAWLVRAVATALEADGPDAPARPAERGRYRGRQGYRGWVR